MTMTISNKFATLVLGLLITALTSQAHAAPPRYRLAVVEPLKGCSQNRAMAINAKGQVAANAFAGPRCDVDIPFLWQAGRSTPRRKGVLVTDINYNGWMSGNQYDGLQSHAVIFKPGGAMTIIPIGMPGSEARAINNRNKVVGITRDSDFIERSPFLYEDGVVTYLESYGVTSVETINDLDQVAGYCGGKACIYQNGHVRTLDMRPLTVATATDINQAGQVVGHYYARSTQVWPRGFLLTGGVVTDLGNALPSDIDNDGNIVGRLIGHAFIHTGGRTYDLNALTTNLGSFKLRWASQINSRGQIVGVGNTASGAEHGFVLTPIASSAATD